MLNDALSTAEDRESDDNEKALIAGTFEYVKSFEEAMEDDLNTADAITAIFELVRAANSAVRSNDDKKVSRKLVQAYLDKLVTLCDVLGLIALKKDDAETDPEAEEIEALIAKRKDAKKNKDFALADSIRNELLERGIVLEDTREGTKWKRA